LPGATIPFTKRKVMTLTSLGVVSTVEVSTVSPPKADMTKHHGFRPRAQRRLLLLAALLAAALMAPAGASAAGFTAPADVSDGRIYGSGLGDFPAFEADGSVDFGYITDQWYEPVVARHAAGSTAFAFSGVLGSVTSNQARVAMATRADGAAAIVWAQYGRPDGNASYSLVVRERSSATGTWGTVSVLSAGAGDSDSPRMATLPNGTYVLVWEQATAGLMVSRKPVGGSWSTPVRVDSAFPLYDDFPTLGRLLVGPTGELALLMNVRASTVGEYREVVVESGDGGLTWSASELGDAINAYTDLPSAAFGPDGSLWATWYRGSSDPLVDYLTEVGHRSAGQVWSDANAPVGLNGPSGTHSEGGTAPSIAVAPNGDVYVALVNSDTERYVTEYGGAMDTVDVYVRQAGTWSGPEQITPIGAWSRPHIAVAGDGSVVATWSGSARDAADAMPYDLYSASKPAGGNWTDPAPFQVASLNQYDTSLSAGPTGDIVAAWMDGGVYRSSVYTVGPAITGLTVPTSVRTDQPLAVSVSATSPWTTSSPTVAWFVDGDPTSDAPVAIGTSVSLSVTTAGTHFVYARVTDANGTVQRKVEVVVSLPPLPPDADGDGLPDSTDCAPKDREKPAHGGVADVNCNGVDDATDAALEAARLKAIADAIKKAQDEALAAIQKEVLKGFMLAASLSQKAVPKAAPVAKIATGTLPIGYTAKGPQANMTQISAMLNGSNVVAAGGGNVIAAGGGNVIAPGGANVVAAGGGNVIAPGGANLINANGVVAAGGMNVIAPGGGNSLRSLRRKAPRARQVLLGGAGFRFTKAGRHRSKLKLTPAGKRVFAAYKAKAKQLRRRHRRVPPLVIRITTIVGPAKYHSGPATYTTRTFTIRA
jgi:hypothetical protein